MEGEGEKKGSLKGAFLNYSQRVLVESVVAVGGGVVVVVPISWARRDATPRFTSRRFYGYRFFRRYSPIGRF